MRLPTAADSRDEVIGLSELTAAVHSLRFNSGLTLVSENTILMCWTFETSLSQICCFFLAFFENALYSSCYCSSDVSPCCSPLELPTDVVHQHSITAFR